MTAQHLTTINPAQPQRISLIAAMAARYNMEPSAFQATIKATVMPANATNEQMAAFLLVANEYDLNPITKEIYAFPAKGGGVTPVVGIDGWINLAQRRPEFDGMEHEWAHDEKGNPISCTCKVYRKDRTRPVIVTEFMDECRRQTDPWRSHPRRMLRHKATIQAIRYAFGFAGIKDEDDAEVIYASATVVDAPKSSANVADLNARLAASVESVAQPTARAIEHQETTDPHPTAEGEAETPEWPQANADGELVDVRGIAWDERIHSSSRNCNDDGTWRRRRGVDPALVAKFERATHVETGPETAPEPEPAIEGEAESSTAPDPLTFEQIREGMATAADEDVLNDWVEESRQVIITQSQRATLDLVYDQRLRQLTAGQAA